MRAAGVFAAVVDEALQRRALAIIAARSLRLSDEELLERLSALLSEVGLVEPGHRRARPDAVEQYLSEEVWQPAACLPAGGLRSRPRLRLCRDQPSAQTPASEAVEEVAAGFAPRALG